VIEWCRHPPACGSRTLPLPVNCYVSPVSDIGRLIIQVIDIPLDVSEQKTASKFGETRHLGRCILKDE